MDERRNERSPSQLQPIKDLLEMDCFELASHPEERKKRKELLKGLVFAYKIAVLQGQPEDAEPIYTQFLAESEDLFTKAQLDSLEEITGAVDKAIFGGETTL